MNTRELSADEGRQIHAGCKQNLCDHRGGSGFAVGAGNTDCIVIPAGHNAQQFASLQYRHTAGLCRDQFRIVCHNCSCVHNQVSAFDIFCTLSQENRNAHIPDCLERLCLIIVRAGEVISFCVQNLSQRIHAAATDSDKVDVLFTLQNVNVHKNHLFLSCKFKIYSVYF